MNGWFLIHFNNLKKQDQILNIDYFAVEIGCYASDLDAKSFEKVPLPEISVIQESESNSDSFFDNLGLRTRSQTKSKLASFPSE